MKILREHVCSSHADSKNLDLQQKGNLFAVDIYALDRMYLCTSLSKGKCASLHKHKEVIATRHFTEYVIMHRTYT